MKVCLLSWLVLVGCVQHYIPVAEHQGVHSYGPGGSITWPTTVAAIQAELESQHSAMAPCTEGCGVYVNIVFDEYVSLADVSAFRNLIVEQAESLPGPTYVRVMYGPSGVHLYAQIIVGQVKLL